MVWQLFALFAAFLWGSANNIDKYVLSKWVKNPYSLILVVGVLALVAAAAIYFFQGFSAMSLENILLAFVAGAFIVGLSLLYLKAVHIEEISRVAPLFYLAPGFTAVLAAIFLGEILEAVDYVGVVFLVSGAVFLSVRNIRKIHIGPAFWLMMGSALFWSFELLILKYLLGFANYWTVFGYEKVGTFLACIPLFFLFSKDLRETVREHGAKVVLVISVSEGLAVLAGLFVTIAASVGFVTLVNALASVQPFFVLAIAVFLSLFFPHILKEEVTRPTLAMKLVAIMLIFTGAVLVS